jgi:hypothetical protein
MNIQFRLMMLGGVILALTGCATIVAPNYSPNYEAIDQLKKISADHISVGTVQPTDPNAKVNHISLRAASLGSPSGTFAKYLENALISDLTEMGFYDASSATRIDATILRNDIDISGISTGSGVMEVNIKITKSGTVSFEKSYLATTQFESSFVGAVAIPKGQSEYPNLVRVLLQQIYSDSAFIQAIKK